MAPGAGAERSDNKAARHRVGVVGAPTGMGRLGWLRPWLVENVARRRAAYLRCRVNYPGPPRPRAAGPGSHDAADSIRRNALVSFAAQMTTAAFTAFLTLFLVRKLGPEEFGLFALALSLGTLVSVPIDAGITGSAARFIAERRRQRAAVAAVMADALKLKAATSLVLSVALAGFAGLIGAAFGEPDLVWPLRGIALAVFGQGMVAFFAQAFIAQGKAVRNLPLYFWESALETGASVCLVLLGAGAAGAAFGRGIGYILGAVLGLMMTVRILGSTVLRARVSGPGMRRIGQYAGSLIVIEGAWILLGRIDSILLGAFLGTVSVGIYQAPRSFVTFLNYPGLAIANGVAPTLAYSRDDGPNVDALLAGTRLLVILYAALTAPLLVWSGPIVDVILGSKYEDSAKVLRALAPSVFVSGLAPLVTMSVAYLGQAPRRIPIGLGTVAINFALDVVLIQTIGVVGAAIGASVALTFYVVGHFWICKRILGFPLKPTIVRVLRAGAASLAMASVLLAVGDSDLSLSDWIVGSLAGTVAFVAILMVTGEVTSMELARVRALVARRLFG
jgi:O-antigen/teichoic acid export membrane protein